jgi:hypothetical protein
MLALTIQSLKARALDDGIFVLLTSIDLSSAFDVMNVELLFKRFEIVACWPSK